MRFSTYNTSTKTANYEPEAMIVEYNETDTYVTDSTDELGILNFLLQDPWTLASSSSSKKQDDISGEDLSDEDHDGDHHDLQAEEYETLSGSPPREEF